MLAANRLLTARCLLNRTSGCVLRLSRNTINTGQWPEPITQQTLSQFLDDIDYFEQPKDFINIGLKLDKISPLNRAEAAAPVKGATGHESSPGDQLDQFDKGDVANLLDVLGEDIDLPPLDMRDAILDQEQLKNLAIVHCIYRDLFGRYQPRREHIKFTPEQAKRLSKLVPYHWITDQPYARAERHLKKTDPLHYFEPLVGVSASFVFENNGDKYAHTSYYGNVIPASEALAKPSIILDGQRLHSRGEPNLDNKNQSNDSIKPIPGLLTMKNFAGVQGYHTLVMLNLDSLHPDCANLHWMLANIKITGSEEKVDSDEVCEYLPVHGIRGFGHSRYVFLVLQHQSILDLSNLKYQDFSPATRRFDVMKFIKDRSNIGMTPVGISWFQTNWDQSSNKIFHDYMKTPAPVYEVVQEKMLKRDILDKAYPGKIPFNIFMDHYRNPKEINEKVLLERLKDVDPYDYKDQYEPPKVPPTIFTDENIPSWMTTVMFKKKNKIGNWRGLRPASSTLPLDNNADLDSPIKPLSSKSLPASPNLYPAKVKKKLLRDLPYSKPLNEHTNIYVQESHGIHLSKAKALMKSKAKENDS